MKKLYKVFIFSLLITNFSLLAIGRTDVVGYTTNDWQFSGPVYTRCRTDLIDYGIHVCWKGTSSGMYNYYNFATRQWNWSNGMTLPFSPYSMDNNPIIGNVTFSSVLSATTPFVVRDVTPGAGLFEYCNGPSGYLWPILAISNNQAIHVAMFNNNTSQLCYSRVQPWCTWSTPILIADSASLCYNIAASEISNKIAVLWENATDLYPERVFYRLSNDGGINWQPTIQLPFPPSVGLVPGYNSYSLFAIFDNQDNLHIVTSVSDTGYTIPAEIWLYSPANTQPWTLVHHYNANNLSAPVGYNATFATRPSIVQNPTTGYFYVSWEQFDSLNYEPITDRARADIYIVELRNNGQTVYAKQRITIPNTTSKRFPILGGVFSDTLVVNYLIDSIAGFEWLGEGRATNNPVVCHFIPIPFPASHTEEYSTLNPQNYTLNVLPNPFSSHTAIHFSLSAQTNVSLQLYDVSGKLVKTLVNEQKNPGNYSFILNSSNLNPGVYFSTLKTGNKTITQKIVKTD